MNKLFVLFTVFSILLWQTPASAERLGVCIKCKTEYGNEVQFWTTDIILELACPVGSYSGGGDPIQCDNREGIFRYKETNDPFRKCTSSPSNHEVWIGGENNDLLAFSNPGNELASGGFHRIQDGEEFTCREDVQQGDRFTALRFGKRRDLINIYVRDGEKSHDFSVSIPDGYSHSMKSGAEFVAVMAGEHKDQLHLFGVASDGKIVRYSEFVNDGRYHDLQVLTGNSVGVLAGQNSDMRRTYCFTNDQWSRAMPAGVNQPFPPRCTERLTSQ